MVNKCPGEPLGGGVGVLQKQAKKKKCRIKKKKKKIPQIKWHSREKYRSKGKTLQQPQANGVYLIFGKTSVSAGSKKTDKG